MWCDYLGQTMHGGEINGLFAYTFDFVLISIEHKKRGRLYMPIAQLRS